MGLITTIDPLRRIHAQGWAYRKVVSGPVKPIVFWGMWVIFGPTMLMPIFFLHAPFSLGMAGSFITFVFSAVILCRVTRNYMRYRLSNENKKDV